MANKSALLVVDMQEDFCEPHGSLAVKGGRDIAGVVNELLSYPSFAVKVATRDWHPKDHISFASMHEGAEAFTSKHTIRNPENEDETQTTFLWPDHCVQGTKGAELIPELHKEKLSHVVDKGQDKRVESYSAFGPPFRKPRVSMSELDGILKGAGVSDVFVVGLAYDFCVKATAIDAAEFGYRTFLVEEGTRGVLRESGTLEKLREELREKDVVVVGMESAEVKAVRG